MELTRDELNRGRPLSRQERELLERLEERLDRELESELERLERAIAAASGIQASGPEECGP